MFDNGSFLRRRKRYKRPNVQQNMHFSPIFGTFSPFWIRKPVPVLPMSISHTSISIFNDSFEENMSYNCEMRNLNMDESLEKSKNNQCLEIK